MGRLQRRNDPLHLSAHPEPSERLLVRRGDVLCATRVLQPRVLGTHTGVVEPGGDRVGAGDLSFGSLQDVGADSVENSFRAEREGGGVVGRVES